MKRIQFYICILSVIFFQLIHFHKCVNRDADLKKYFSVSCIVYNVFKVDTQCKRILCILKKHIIEKHSYYILYRREIFYHNPENLVFQEILSFSYHYYNLLLSSIKGKNK